MKSLAIATTFGLLAILLLAFTPMSHTEHHMAGQDIAPCPIVALLNLNCPADTLMALVHVEAFQTLINNPLTSIYLFFSLVLLVGLAYTTARLLYLSLNHRVSCLKPVFIDTNTLKIRQWIRLFENSPTFF